MDTQLKLHPDHLSMFVEPEFKRQTLGYYSVGASKGFQINDSEKASLVALKEAEKTTQGVVEYQVPSYIEELDLNEGTV